MQKSRKEPEVVVFEEPKYHIRKGGKEEAKERKIFLVSVRSLLLLHAVTCYSYVCRCDGMVVLHVRMEMLQRYLL